MAEMDRTNQISQFENSSLQSSIIVFTGDSLWSADVESHKTACCKREMWSERLRVRVMLSSLQKKSAGRAAAQHVCSDFLFLAMCASVTER